MIGRLRGTLVAKTPPLLLLDINGVGYEVEASMNTIYNLPKLQEQVILFTHLIIKDTSHNLYGFSDEQERLVFKELIKINGVGPKLALTILSGMDVAALMNCVEQGDLAQLVRLPGVGKKTAERLLIEMQHKFKQLTKQASFDRVVITSPKSSMQQEAVSALIALGYKSTEATDIIKAVANDADDCESLIRLALQRSLK